MSLRGVGVAVTAALFAFGGFIACVDDAPGSAADQDQGDAGSVEASSGYDGQSSGGYDASVDTGSDASGTDATGNDAHDSGADTNPVCVPGCVGDVSTTCPPDGGVEMETCAHGCAGDGGLAHCLTCTPTTVEQLAPEPCGTKCGTQTPTRTCQADGTWGAPVAGTCGNEGVCVPNSTQTVHDHRCVICSASGTYASDTSYMLTCTAACTWGPQQNVVCGTPCTP